MQPYQSDYQAPYMNEQEYQTIPEDQAYPVFWRNRRRNNVIVPIIIPFSPYPFPYFYYPYFIQPFPYGGFGGTGGFGGFGGF